MSSELSFEASDEASENELLERSLSVWRGSCAIEWDDFTPIALDIHTACSIGHFEYVKSIIQNVSGQEDRKNKGGWTPLMYASYIGHDNIVKLLIKEGCNMNMKNPKGHTPLMLAASCGNEGVARLLVRSRAHLEVKDNNGWTALFHATYAGHQNFVAFLLQVGANKDAVEPSSGMTPFMVAAAEGHEIIVQQFLQHEVNIHTKTRNGDMARNLAILNGHIKVVSLIDNHMLPIGSLRSEPGLEHCVRGNGGKHLGVRQVKLQGPSIRDGPEAIARMIDRTRLAEPQQYTDSQVPNSCVMFPAGAGEETTLSYRDVTSPINPEDYKDGSSSREFDDFNDDSNAFSKTGAITIKSSSSSSGGLVAALGLSRDGSLDSDDSHSYELTSSSEEALDGQLLTDHLQHQSLKMMEGKGERLSGMADANGRQEVSPGHSKEGAAATLKSYFPCDKSFDVAVKEYPTCGVNNLVSQQQDLPKGNMTQAEIVNRYLKNLVRGQSSNSHYAGFTENLWASDERDPEGLEVRPHLNTHPNVDAFLPSTKSSGEPSIDRDELCSNFATGVTCSEYHHDSLVPGVGSKNNFVKDLSENVGHPRSQYQHQPLLNHHHPLHGKYYPSVVSSGQDMNYNLPQSYICNNRVTMGHQQVESSVLTGQADPTVNPLLLLNNVFSGTGGSPAEQSPALRHNQPTSSPPRPDLKKPTTDSGKIAATYNAQPTAALLPSKLTSSQPEAATYQWLDDQGLCLRDGPRDLKEMLSQLGLIKYLDKFEEQDVDLQVFLSLTDNDLKEIGIKLFGPRKKMTNAIARWHSSAPVANNSLEQAYADRLEGEMQEMAIRLNKAYDNEERLKAQILQEQQLRSVTEQCLMEERSSWELASRSLLETQNKMRSMGEMLSRLRHHLKDLQKLFGGLVGGTHQSDRSHDSTVDSGVTSTNSDSRCLQGNEELGLHCGHLMKKSKRCVKEMQQTLSSLFQSTDRIFKSTNSLSMGNDLT